MVTFNESKIDHAKDITDNTEYRIKYLVIRDNAIFAEKESDRRVPKGDV